MTNSEWKTYYKNVSLEPRKLLVEATSYVKNKENALDLGAGNLRDTIYLLNQGFKKVDVVDKQPEIKEYAQKLNDKRIYTNIKSFNEFEFKKEYDIINAQYALPFIKKDEFEIFFNKTKKSLNKQGIITGQFFGNKDSWKNKRDMTFIDIIKAKDLLKDLKTIYFLEEEKDGKTALGENKHWHVFHFIARKA